MKPLSLRLTIMVIAWTILSSAISPIQRATSFKDNTHYYWYLDADDSYDGYQTIADEIAHLEILTGVYVDTSPYGSDLVANGFSNNAYPHTVWPSSLLYAHY